MPSECLRCLRILPLAIALMFRGVEPVNARGRDEAALPDRGPADTTSAPQLEKPALDYRWPPAPPAAEEYVQERHRMVRTQIENPGPFTPPVKNAAVLEAMRVVPRHAFVPVPLRGSAYDDTPLPIGHGQTISQPYIVAAMTELLEVGAGSKVLEIGTGSGYQAAVLAHLTPCVFSIEILRPLAEKAEGTLRGQGYTGVKVRQADGYYGWPEEAPFDAIILTCAAGHLPAPLWDQLKPGGKMVIPIGGIFSVQRLVVVEKTELGKRKSRSVMGVKFVPMVGQIAQ